VRLVPKVVHHDDDDGDDEALTVHCSNDFPHVTLSCNDGVQAVYSNTLLKRIANVDGSPLKSDFKSSTVPLERGVEWSGVLPALPQHPATTAKLTVLKQPIKLFGAVCLDKVWNKNDHVCDIVPGCSLCRFFMASPCRVEFKKWERCMDIAKHNGEAIEIHCMDSFLDMADCREKNLHYFNPPKSTNDTDKPTNNGPETTQGKSVSESQGSSASITETNGAGGEKGKSNSNSSI
jgi:hypothetical protein